MWGVETPTAVVTAVSKRRRRTSTRLASVVSPDAFAGAVSALLPLFQERYEQQDAQEFLRVSSGVRTALDTRLMTFLVCFGTNAS